MVIKIFFTIIGYFVLLYLSVNLLGFLVRGLFTDPELDRLKKKSHDFIKREIEKSERADKWINILALILIVGYFFVLVHFWNWGVAAVALILILSRLPGLLWEIKHGKRAVSKNLKISSFYFVDIILMWSAFPLLYYFLYLF